MHNMQLTPVLITTDAIGSVIRCRAARFDHPVAYAPFGFHMRSLNQVQSGFIGQPIEHLIFGYLLGNGYRHFHPVLQRFVAPDDLSPFDEGGVNSYVYCSGDPINYVDISGHVGVKYLTQRAKGIVVRPMRGAGDSTYHLLKPRSAAEVTNRRILDAGATLGGEQPSLTAVPNRPALKTPTAAAQAPKPKNNWSTALVDNSHKETANTLPPNIIINEPQHSTRSTAQFIMRKNGEIYVKRMNKPSKPTKPSSSSGASLRQSAIRQEDSTPSKSKKVPKFQWEM